MTLDELNRILHEQDAVIERLQRRIEELERVQKAILTALSIKVTRSTVAPKKGKRR